MSTRIVIGSDHAGLPLKLIVADELQKLGLEVQDYGAHANSSVDFPDFAEPVGRAIQNGEAERGILVCGSGVGMCIAANKMQGIRACVTHDTYSARQGVEHDDMNVMCLGGRIVGEEVARELVRAFIHARYLNEARYQRRLAKVAKLEQER